MQTDKGMGRPHQGMDRPGVHQVAVGSGELRKMEETGCEIVCDAQTTCVFWGQVKLKARDFRLPHWFASTKAKQVSSKTVQAVVGLGEVLLMWLLWSKNKKQNSGQGGEM